MADFVKRVYIEDIDINDIKAQQTISDSKEFQLQPYTEGLPMKASEHVFEIKGESDKEALITFLENKDYLADKQLIDFINKEAPELKEYFYQVPIEIGEFKEQIRKFFGDVPDYIFEGDDYLGVIRKIINHLIKKETVAFVVHGINSGKLWYRDGYYPLMHGAYYRVTRFNFHMESIRMIVELWETFLENHYWKTMFASRDVIRVDELEGIRKFYNFLGRQHTDFIDKLSVQLAHLKKEEVWIKRTTVKPLPDYWSESALAKRNTKDFINENKEQRDILFNRKKDIEQMLRERKSIEKEKIDTLLNGRFGIIKYAIKKWRGLFK